MNTRLSYLYRDACNYKTFNDVIVRGQLEHQHIQAHLKDKTFFIPSEIGLPDLQEETFTVDDHIWHEIISLEPTNEKATIDITAAVLLSRFESASISAWNEHDVMARKVQV